MGRQRISPWKGWIVVTLIASAYLIHALVHGDARMFVNGQTSSGHHQIEEACGACHADPFGGAQVLQTACVGCHGDELKEAGDSHPKRLFTDPRNAERVKIIDAKRCVTCHTEHRPGLTGVGGVSVPADNCVYCHADIGKERPSHAGLSAVGCAAGGCHNYHDNSALYEDFLTKHLHDAETNPQARLAERNLLEFLRATAAKPVRALQREDQDAPATLPLHSRIVTNWSLTAHANAGVNCTDCHARPIAANAGKTWRDKPDLKVCRECHRAEAEGFLHGKHGMRIAQDLSPMSPALARQPMNTNARDKVLTCNSCHPPHRYDTHHAATNACLGCHDDKHSRAYKESPHYRLWRDEVSRRGPPGSGVSCASCHLPREFHREQGVTRVRVEHNQNKNLRPNEKMIRGVCLTCHGLGFTIDALADPILIERNFKGRPRRHIESLEMAEKRHNLQKQQENVP
jgi:hypothetical protein